MTVVNFPICFAGALLLFYACGRLLLAAASSRSWRLSCRSKKYHAKKGTTKEPSSVKRAEEFQLERRAFFSKTWLFVCHSSQFLKVGDYHTFEIAGVSFFIVLGKDLKLRAFHNICRHRAYTVVRKDRGNSTRFSCKYHGWQYDDKGGIVKAPKFEDMPGFTPADNGLFEIALVRTSEGFVFVNFQSEATKLSFHEVRSNLHLAMLQWKDEFEIDLNSNWKPLASAITNDAAAARDANRWPLPWQKPRTPIPLGPFSRLEEVEEDVWCIESVIPTSADTTKLRFNMFVKAGMLLSSHVVERWKARMEKDLAELETSDVFSYECGGRRIELSAVLAQQIRQDHATGSKKNPAFRFTGTDIADFEAEALASTLDRKMNRFSCSVPSSCSTKVEW